MTKALDRPPSFISRASLATELDRYFGSPVDCINGARALNLADDVPGRGGPPSAGD